MLPEAPHEPPCRGSTAGACDRCHQGILEFFASASASVLQPHPPQTPSPPPTTSEARMHVKPKWQKAGPRTSRTRHAWRARDARAGLSWARVWGFRHYSPRFLPTFRCSAAWFAQAFRSPASGLTQNLLFSSPQGTQQTLSLPDPWAPTKPSFNVQTCRMRLCQSGCPCPEAGGTVHAIICGRGAFCQDAARHRKDRAGTLSVGEGAGGCLRASTSLTLIQTIKKLKPTICNTLAPRPPRTPCRSHPRPDRGPARSHR